MCSEAVGRKHLKLRFPIYRDVIEDYDWPAFTLLCEAYGMAIAMRDAERRSRAMNPDGSAEFEAMCIELEFIIGVLLCPRE